MTRARNLAGLGTVTAQPTTTTPVHLGPLGVGTFARIYGTWEHDQINSVSIGTTQLQISGITTGLNVSGIITAQNGLNITGNIVNGLNVTAGIATLQALTATTGTFTGDTTFSGAVSIAGTLTYEDVTAVDVIGVATFRSDLNIADKIVHTGDTNTAIRFPSADAFTVETGGSELVRVNTTNVTIKNTAAAWNKIQRAAATDYAGIAVQEADATQRMQFGVAGGSNQIVTGAAQHDVCLKAYDANLILATDATERLRIASTGKVGINQASPDGMLHVFSSSAGTVTANAGGDELVLESSGNTGLSILSPGTGESTIFFGNPGTNGERDGYIRYYHESHSTVANRRCLSFIVGGGDNERLRISGSNGNVGIGSLAPTGKVDIATGGNAYFKFGQDSDNPKLEIFRSTGNASNTHYGAELQLLTGDFCYSNAPAADLGNHTFTERLRIRSGGQLCVGTTSGPGEIGLYLGDGTNPAGHIYANGTHHMYMLANSYYAGGWKYLGNGEANSLSLQNGLFVFNNAPTNSSGAAAAVTWTERFRIDANGNVGLSRAPKTQNTFNAIELGQAGFVGSQASNSTVEMATNAYYNSGWKYMRGSEPAMQYYQYNGYHAWTSAGNGDADAALTLIEKMRLDADGRLLIGISAARTYEQPMPYGGNDSVPALQLEGAGDSAGIHRIFAQTYNNNDVYAPTHIFAKTRGGSTGSVTVVNSGDSLGVISFQGADGSDLEEAAQIRAEVEGSAGSNDMPGRLIFGTTADGAHAPTERMYINKNGQVLFAGTPGEGHGISASYGFYALGLATSGSTTDTGISINQGNAGATSLIFACRNTNNGTATQSSLYFMHWYYDGNNAPAATKINGDNITFGVSGSNTLTVTGGAGNFRCAMIWIT